MIVPDNDPDHRGTVYDEEEQGELFAASPIGDDKSRNPACSL